MSDALSRALGARFPTEPHLPDANVAAARPGLPTLEGMARHASCRAFADTPPDDALIALLAGVALSAPTKSDLQQRDIIVVRDASVRAALDACVPGQPWLGAAPLLLVFCGNNRRQRLLHTWWDRLFANDHADAAFNAAVDAAVALSAFVTAAEAVGLGTCPVSGLRDRPETVSDLLGLPHHVFPVAGLAVGWPEKPATISPRLPLEVTLHQDRYSETDLRARIETYDTTRAALAPYSKQRATERFGEGVSYTWSDDKTRQYSSAERAGFGAFLRAKGFRLD